MATFPDIKPSYGTRKKMHQFQGQLDLQMVMNTELFLG